jgi:hypothetical protein
MSEQQVHDRRNAHPAAAWRPTRGSLPVSIPNYNETTVIPAAIGRTLGRVSRGQRMQPPIDAVNDRTGRSLG